MDRFPSFFHELLFIKLPRRSPCWDSLTICLGEVERRTLAIQRQGGSSTRIGWFHRDCRELSTSSSLRLSTAQHRASQVLGGGSSGTAGSEECQWAPITHYSPPAPVPQPDSSRKRLSLQPPPAGVLVPVPRSCGVSKDGSPRCPLLLRTCRASGAAFRTRRVFQAALHRLRQLLCLS